MSVDVPKKEFHVVTTIGFHLGFDEAPINNALYSSLSNKKISCIHVLSESPLDLLRETVPLLNDDRVKLISVNQRPSFKDLIDFCNNLAIGSKITVSLMNADTSFEGERDIERCLKTLDICSCRGHNAVLTISRRDKKYTQFGLFLRDNIGIPNFVSADCWVFSPPLTPIDVDYFFMGQINCDLMLTFSLNHAGHFLLNPCVDISVLHHEAEIKNENFYEKENKKTTAIDIINWHWAKNCIVPYHYYGVIWNRIKWIENGYLPAPIKDFGKKRVYLLVSGLLDKKLEQQIIYFVEIICCSNGLDLIIMGEDIYEINIEIISKIASVSRNTYFVQVESLDQVSSNLISDLNNRHESVAWINQLRLLMPSLLTEFHSVIFDIRNISNVIPIEVPSGHSDLYALIIGRYNIDVDDLFTFEQHPSINDSCTLVTAMYKSDQFIQGFYDNITALDGYESYVHVILFSQLSKLEKDILISWNSKHRNLILGWFKKDPGLYECWNIGIRLAPTEYVSNANVDDLRNPAHVDKLLECLCSRPNIAFAASSIIAFDKYTSRVEDIDGSNPWYVDESGKFGMERLAKIEKDEHGKWMLIPNNIPHCMPLWRKSLHEKFGFFNENRYGTFADWAFWLKVTKGGENGFLDPAPLGYYYINLSSHNRRGDKLNQFHHEVEIEFLDALLHRKNQSIDSLLTLPKVNTQHLSHSNELPRKLHLTGLNQEFGQHRNSFNLLIESLLPLHDDKSKIEFIPFIERYFVWGDSDGEAASINPRPLHKPWIGILHVPFDTPRWFECSVSPETIFMTNLWKSSLSFCKGIICLTEDLQKDLYCWYPNLATIAVKFPTDLNVKKFNWKTYKANPRLLQAGDWLRRLQFIYEINAPSHEKIMLMKQNTALFLQREVEAIGDYRNDSVKVIDFISNDEYDGLLSSSIVLLWLYGTSANNIIIECIARSTPLLVNPLPGVVEYLGSNYPLYINSLDDAASILLDKDKIREGYDYLISNDQLREKLTYQNFFTSIACSDFYAKL